MADLKQAAIAVLSIIAEIGHKKPGDSGARDCPACGGTLRWAILPGSRRGLGYRIACDTGGCIKALS